MNRRRDGRPAAMSEGTSGFASSAARPRRAPHGSRSASAAKDVALAALATAPPALTRRTLRLSRLQRSSARVSESRAALQTRVRERRFKMLRPRGDRRGLDVRPALRDAGADICRRLTFVLDTGSLIS